MSDQTTSPLSYVAEVNSTSSIPENFFLTSPLTCIDVPIWHTEDKQETSTEKANPSSPAPLCLPSAQDPSASENSETHSFIRPGRPMEQGKSLTGTITPVFAPQDVPGLTHSPSPDSPSGRSPASHARKTSPGHVKRPCNAFILFRSHAVTTNLIPKEVERDHRNISRIISHMWHSLDDDERKLWERQAEIEKQRHREMHPDYKYRPSSRRNNVLRRTARRLSSTERQCERIADAILKSCGREGVKRQRLGKHSSRKHFDDHASFSSNDIPQHQATKHSSPTGCPFMTITEPSQSYVPSPSPVDITNSNIPETKPCQALPIRRSSSAPPCGNELETFCASATSLLPDTMNESLPWLLESPLIYPMPTIPPKSCPNESVELSQVATYQGPTMPHIHDLQSQPDEALISIDDTSTFSTPQLEEPFYLGPKALPQNVPPMHRMPPAFIPPVSPRTQDVGSNSMTWENLFPPAETQTPLELAPLAPTIVNGLLEQPLWPEGGRALGLVEPKFCGPADEEWIQNGVQSFFDLIHGTSTV